MSCDHLFTIGNYNHTDSPSHIYYEAVETADTVFIQ